MAQAQGNKGLPAENSGGSSPFDGIRHVDAYGREYWLAREMQPLMHYTRWEKFCEVVEKAKGSLALVQGPDQAENHFTAWGSDGGRWGNQKLDDYRLTRFGAYLTAMAGDDTKEPVAQARIYFAVRTREAELGAITLDERRQTALARAREMVDYQIFRDMMRDNAPDYQPSSKATGLFFATMQNMLYEHIVGMTAKEILNARDIATWPGRADGKPEPSLKSAARKVAKNYLTGPELRKLERLVARLCLTAEDIAEDGMHLSLGQWQGLVETELRMASRQIAA